ncbi:MAG: right-handed parallel beta-helix repeat-containing protein [Methylovulum sp.]|uniref:right-handed parallel beta-helix repeat-containing protein n=1 Tax=Methylovulum sp. TaxID=1916980 RepID=UPI00261B9D15|nr:right-handed parallel beta-helix repeat-containing protein [Methylovulum sp.]MDD2724409.1 right-handed parallel beta-helix repeat-containing protein [Methylovulum sp.]MDD5124006.1 right-handed parallel beta-helix repeat-containing protein [Methylovulum sp.]
MNTLINCLPFHRHALALALALAISPVHAGTINVGGTCTLANAINNANTDSDTDGVGGCPAGSSADILRLKANQTYTLNTVNNLNQGPNGLPSITSKITVNGNGAVIKRSNAADTPSFRLFRIGNNGNLILNNLTVSGGKLEIDNFFDGYGAGVLNGSSLTLINSTIAGNAALGTGALGSGIANGYKAVLALNNSTVSGNQGATALANIRGTTTLINSTVSGNHTINGGVAGIVNIETSTMTLINSTVSGNSSLDPAQYGIGAIQNSGTMALVHSTVSNNRIAHGVNAGIQNNGSLTLTNSLIANSTGGTDCFSAPAAITLRGTNLIEDGACNAPLSGDPKLAPLLDNGGATLTHALRNISPAANVANTLCKKTDQRYVSRPQPIGGICDIGAFEQIKPIPANIKTLINFFDAQVSGGGIVGIGSNPTYKLNAVRNQLLTAGDNKIASLNTQACSQLSKTLTRLDADNLPDKTDYATGSQIAALITQINALRSAWVCQ